MTLCPVAVAIGCRKCPIFAICPVKGIIGDYKKPVEAPAQAAPKRAKAKGGAKGGAKKRR